ncbi:hypothetical protein ACFVFJ_44685 [Streptomyces sp. NPDC057717]|uniref:hypothetical protein n=1 Tax=unclassified Streptomyces TaxID=2593676 RepID=UPI00369C86EC
MSAPRPSRSLSNAGEQVREFNHTSRDSGPGWEFPSGSYDAVGALAHLARMLPQAIEQSTLPAMRTHKNGRLLIDGGRDADVSVVLLQTTLAEALEHANALAVALDRMHSATSPMAVDTRGLPGFDDESEH